MSNENQTNITNTIHNVHRQDKASYKKEEHEPHPGREDDIRMSIFWSICGTRREILLSNPEYRYNITVTPNIENLNDL